MRKIADSDSSTKSLLGKSKFAKSPPLMDFIRHVLSQDPSIQLVRLAEDWSLLPLEAAHTAHQYKFSILHPSVVEFSRLVVRCRSSGTVNDAIYLRIILDWDSCSPIRDKKWLSTRCFERFTQARIIVVEVSAATNVLCSPPQRHSH